MTGMMPEYGNCQCCGKGIHIFGPWDRFEGIYVLCFDCKAAVTKMVNNLGVPAEFAISQCKLNNKGNFGGLAP